MAFPITLDDFTPKVDNTNDVMAIDINELQTAIEAMQSKIGINASEVTSSLDYLIKAASNPGHTHTAYVPVSRTVNTKALSADIVITPDDLNDTSTTHKFVSATDISNWNGKQDALGFTPENVANKVTSISGSSTDTQYPSAKLVYDQLATKLATSAFTDAAVTGKLLTGYSSGAGTVAATDTILQAIQKLNGNIGAITLSSLGGFSNPMTTIGDIIYGGASGVATRLGLGTAGQVLKVNSGANGIEWGTSASGGADILQVQIFS